MLPLIMTIMHCRWYFSITIHGNDAVTVACISASCPPCMVVLQYSVPVQYSCPMNTHSACSIHFVIIACLCKRKVGNLGIFMVLATFMEFWLFSWNCGYFHGILTIFMVLAIFMEFWRLSWNSVFVPVKGWNSGYIHEKG